MSERDPKDDLLLQAVDLASYFLGYIEGMHPAAVPRLKEYDAWVKKVCALGLTPSRPPMREKA